MASEYVDLEVDKRMNMLFEENRLSTFNNWVFSDNEPCNKLKLAEAGFFFIGNENEPDVVQCFLCGKTLDGWEPTDDPWGEHIKHSSNCQFAQLMSPEGSLTYYQFLDIKAALLKNIFQKIYDIEKENLNNKINEMKNYLSKCLK